MQTVFITTSGLGTRLKGLTEFTNKALVPIGDRYAICHIIDAFPAESTRFVVTLGYYGRHVEEFLRIAYPSHTFVFVEVSPFEGTGSSQAFSMLQAEPFLQDPFLYHCCDTILPTYPSPLSFSSSTAAATMWVSNHADYTSYTGITTDAETGKLLRLNRKSEAIHDYAYIGIAWIANPTWFWGALRAAWSAGDGAAHLGDTDAYRRLLQYDRESVDYRVIPTFYDTGNVDSYRHACEAFPSKHLVIAKPQESLCFIGGVGGGEAGGRVIKFQHSVATNRRRAERGRLLEELGVGPRILGSAANFMAMSFEKGTVLAECREWGEVRRLLNWVCRTLWSQKKDDDRFRDVCARFYFQKTHERLAAYRQKRPHEDAEWINGCRVGSMASVMAAVDWNSLYTSTFSHFHGDFILDNIIRRDDGSFVLLDWRDTFDTELEWGDVGYDLAKLRHNLVFHHSNILKEMYSVRREGEHVFVDLACNYLLMRQLEELDEWAASNGYSVRRIRILQALIWINMAPLYDGALCDFLYYFGKWNLWLQTIASASAEVM